LPPPPCLHQVLLALTPDERKLFMDRIRALDRRIIPGVTKLSWVCDKHSLDVYHKEARKYCRAAETTVVEFKEMLAHIQGLCKSISNGLLVNVEKKKLYEYTEFEAVQASHHAQVRSS
jgi:dynein heavy chain